MDVNLKFFGKFGKIDFYFYSKNVPPYNFKSNLFPLVRSVCVRYCKDI